MRRRLLTCALLATVATGLVAGSALGLRHPGARYARAHLIACHPALAQPDRFLTVEGAMRSLRHGNRMAIRFDLLRRGPGGPSIVPGPGLGIWNPAEPGVDRYRYRKRVENLGAPGRYRVVVSFRWATPAGRVVGLATRVTRACRQPDLRPDLRIGRILVGAGPDTGTRTYTVTVRNDGGSLAQDFDVVLTVNGTQGAPQNVAQLGAGQRHQLAFTAARCQAGTSLTAAADPDGRVSERSELNNSRTVPCPTAAAAR